MLEGEPQTVPRVGVVRTSFGLPAINVSRIVILVQTEVRACQRQKGVAIRGFTLQDRFEGRDGLSGLSELHQVNAQDQIGRQQTGFKTQGPLQGRNGGPQASLHVVSDAQIAQSFRRLGLQHEGALVLPGRAGVIAPVEVLLRLTKEGLELALSRRVLAGGLIRCPDSDACGQGWRCHDGAGRAKTDHQRQKSICHGAHDREDASHKSTGHSQMSRFGTVWNPLPLQSSG